MTPTPVTPQDIIGMIWQSALALSVIGGAAIAAWRLNIFRYVQPSVTIELEVHSCEAAPSWNAITIIAKITNTSRVKITIPETHWGIRSLAPYTDEWIAEHATSLLSSSSVEAHTFVFPWDVIHHITETAAGAYVEPGETHTEAVSLPISAAYRDIDVLVAFRRSTWPKGKLSSHVWAARRVHRIDRPVETSDPPQSPDPSELPDLPSRTTDR